MPEPTLLDATDPDPVRVLRPDGGSDFLLTADHAGRAVPRRLGDLGVHQGEWQRHIAWDIGIAAVTERLSRALDATAVLQTYSRLVIDCNRRPDWDSAIPTISEHTEIPGNRGISPAEREARRREIFEPYHRAKSPLCSTGGRRPAGARCSSRCTASRRSSRARRATSKSACSTTATSGSPAIMLDLFRAEGDLAVGDNAPYAITDSSDYTVPTHGEARGLPHVEIEIRQDLIADPAGQDAWAARLARLLPIADARLREIAGRGAGDAT